MDERGRQQRCQRTVKLAVIEASSEAVLDIEVGQIVAKMWMAEIVRRAMAMNQGGDYEGVEAFLKVEVGDFKAYCATLPDVDDLIENAERTRRTVRRPMQQSLRKEVHTAQFRMIQCTPDTRSRVKQSSWVDLLDE